MEFTKRRSCRFYFWENQTAFCLGAVVLAVTFLAGCGDQVQPPSASEMAEFNQAGLVRTPALHTTGLEQARIAGPYLAAPGDALELTMPAILRTVGTEEVGAIDRIMPYLCRVRDTGTIMVPRAGDIKVEGKTLAQIESLVVEAYYPKYIVTRPSVFVRVADYGTCRVTVAGAVMRPGIYSLRRDQMSVAGLVMEAGGIVEGGAAMIRVFRLDGTSGAAANASKAESSPLVLPVYELNVPLMDVALRDGDRVVVDRRSQPPVTVIGLVNRPGSFPYPPDVQYNLTQALALAGGLNPVAEPRYATVYRLKPDGTNIHVTFEIADNSELTEEALTVIKPGDIVDVAQTPRTRTALFLDRLFAQISLGAYYRLDEAWSD